MDLQTLCPVLCQRDPAKCLCRDALLHVPGTCYQQSPAEAWQPLGRLCLGTGEAPNMCRGSARSSSVRGAGSSRRVWGLCVPAPRHLCHGPGFVSEDEMKLI